MPRSTLLQIRASRGELAFSAVLPIPSSSLSQPAPVSQPASLPQPTSLSQPTPSSSSTQLIQRCRHCLRIIPLGSSLQRHVWATFECREAEDRDVRTGLASQARQREWRFEQERQRMRELERERKRQPEEECEREQAIGWVFRIQGLTLEGESATKRRRVEIEEEPDVDAPQITIPSRSPTPGPSTLYAPSPLAQAVSGVLDTEPNVTARRSSEGSELRSVPSTSSQEHVPQVRSLRRGGGQRRWKGMLVEEFPEPLAGAPISTDRAPELDLEAYTRSTGKFKDPKTFEVVDMLMTSGMTDSNKERHLRSDFYRDRTPWKTLREMLSDLDELLPTGPEFTISEIGDTFGKRPVTQYLVKRNALELLRDLFKNTEYDGNFFYKPAKYRTSGRRRERVYFDTQSGDWWWREQEKLQAKGKRAATIASIMLASDETNLSIMCGGQTAYPVYLTIGNISKHWRRKPSKRAMVLLGFLPVDPFDDIENDDERRRLKANLVHRCMEEMLRPLKEVWDEGVDMWCPDRRLRRVYPRMAAYMADWPEQNLHTCTSISSCPICTTLHKGRGDWDNPSDPRDGDETLAVLRTYFDNRVKRPLKDLGLKPVWPWWGDLPDVDLHKNVAPDVLHQLYQGVFKSHLYRWIKFIVGADVLDERFAAMPKAEGLTHFPKGVSVIRQWTGRESKQILRQILPAVLGDLRPEEAKLARSLIDFTFRAHASSMTESDLGHLEFELDTFHKYKDHLIAIGFYQNEGRFDRIAKLHALGHYVHMIRELGTPDGYSTEAPEHLHIEYAKVPWRASNKVSPLPQMLIYIERQEAVRMHRAHLNRYLGRDLVEEGRDYDVEDVEVDVGPTVEVEASAVPLRDRVDDSDGEGSDQDGGEDIELEGRGDDEGEYEPVTYPNPHRHMAVNPTKRNVTLRNVARSYEAPELMSAITDFLVRRVGIPEYNVMLSPENQLHVWHRLYLHHDPPSFAPFDSPHRDVIRASAPVLGPGGRVTKLGVWDVALYHERPNQRRSRSGNDDREKHGIQRYRAGRVRAFFSLPGHIRQYYPGQLAYVEVFRPFEATPASPYGLMHSTGPELDSRDRRRIIVIPVTEIVLAGHLVPKFNEFGRNIRLTPFTDVLSIGRHFWLNHYYTHYFFQLIQHWRSRRPTRHERLIAGSQ